VLLRLAYLGVTNAFAVLRLLPMGDRDRDVEILALRHQITVLERQLGKERVRFTAIDRALLAALLHRLPLDVLRRLRLLVRPDTVLRWHRDMVARRHAARSRPKRPGRPRTVSSVRALVVRLAKENPCWGYRRVHGELLVLGVKVAASTVWEILKEIDPAPERASSTWADFLRSQADALLACDFYETVTLFGARMHVFAVIEHANRRIRILGATTHPTASWVAQAAKNLVMDTRGRRLPGAVPDPGPGREVSRAVRRCPGGCGDRGRAQRRPNASHELDHGEVGANLPTRAPGSHLDLEPAAPAPRAERVRALLQRAPTAPGHRERPPAAPLALADHRSGQASPPRHTKMRTPRWHPPRVRACCMTCTDEVFGKGSVGAGYLRVTVAEHVAGRSLAAIGS
jgi:hypothetical protein